MRSVRELRHAAVHAKDGAIGFVEQVFFDDEKWTIRYLVLDTGTEFADRRVLVSPMAVTSFGPGDRPLITVRLTRRQVAGSPDIDTEKPVSRQKELEYNTYYLFPAYWGGEGIWGAQLLPAALLNPPVKPESQAQAANDIHLRSSREVIGYRVRARDGKVGHVEDFHFDEASWSLRYVEVDTRNWIGGRHVLLSPRLVESVSWDERSMVFRVGVDAIRSAPAYAPGTPVTQELERQVDAHFS